LSCCENLLQRVARAASTCTVMYRLPRGTRAAVLSSSWRVRTGSRAGLHCTPSACAHRASDPQRSSSTAASLVGSKAVGVGVLSAEPSTTVVRLPRGVDESARSKAVFRFRPCSTWFARTRATYRHSTVSSSASSSGLGKPASSDSSAHGNVRCTRLPGGSIRCGLPQQQGAAVRAQPLQAGLDADGLVDSGWRMLDDVPPAVELQRFSCASRI
jgi:hypothetical protein